MISQSVRKTLLLKVGLVSAFYFIQLSGTTAILETKPFIAYHYSRGLHTFYPVENGTTQEPPPYAPFHVQNRTNTYIGLSYDFERQILFYSNYESSTINSVFFNNTNRRIIARKQPKVVGLHFDAVHSDLYWSRNDGQTVNRLNLRNPHAIIETILQLNSSDSIYGLAMDPFQSRIYWSNSNKDQPSIQRTCTCGSGRIETIISTNIKQPLGLTIDHVGRKLYWTDSALGVIEEADLDGGNRRVIRQQNSAYWGGIAVYGDAIYYTDWRDYTVLKANRITGNDQVVLKESTQYPFVVMAVTSQPQLPCAEFGCSINFKDGTPPPSLTEYWHLSNNQELSLRYANKEQHLLIYADSDFPPSVTWPFTLLSNAWKYVKSAYTDAFEVSAPLYVFLHGNSTDCKKQPAITQKQFRFQNVIDSTSYDDNHWTLNTTGNYETLLTKLAYLVRTKAEGSDVNAGYAICGEAMASIIYYDIYLQSVGLTNDLLEWKVRKQSEHWKNLYCFRDWFLPVYEMHGGPKVIQNILRLTRLNWSHGNASSTKNFNPGEFLHFWSGATRRDLGSFGWTLFNWPTGINEELTEAKHKYPYFLNLVNETHREYVMIGSWIKIWTDPGKGGPLKLICKDDKIEVFIQTFDTEPVEPMAEICLAWKHIQDHYSSFEKDAFLTIVIHNTNQTEDDGKQCTSYIDSTAIQKNAPEIRRVVNCATSTFYQRGIIASGNTNFSKEGLMESLGGIALELSTKAKYWPGQKVSGTTIESIIVYDIYLSIGMTEEAANWKMQSETKAGNLSQLGPKSPVFWFRDWYMLLYDRYGHTAVLKTFFDIVNAHWKSSKQLNKGEYVHLWSGAANVSLLDMAAMYLGWKRENQIEFVKARIALPGLSYTCENCDDWHTNETEEAESTLYTVTGAVIGASLGILILICVAYGLKSRLNKRKIKTMSEATRNLTNKEVDEFYKGINASTNKGDAHAQIHSLPFDVAFEVSKEVLIIDGTHVLGSGEFGVVMKGVLKGDPKKGTFDTTVAVKTVKPNVEVSYFKAMLLEIKILAHLGTHPNITSLLGTITVNIRDRELFLALEFCEKGDLLRYLKSNSQNFQNLFSKQINNPEQNLDNGNTPRLSLDSEFSTQNLLQWSCQVSSGMAYLTSKKVIHGDLAARNVLLTNQNVAKISDFGLSRQLVNYTNYLKTSKTPVPWRWLALESLIEMTFSVQTDVWSFGVTLWEIFSLGKVPFSGRTWNQAFVDDLVNGIRLQCPEFGNEEICNLMLDCMKKEPTERPTFLQIMSKLAEINENLEQRAAQLITEVNELTV